MKYFYKDIAIDVPDGVYYPQEDSELAAEALEKEELMGKKALEIGCGSGLLSIIMSQRGAEVTAVDINPEAVKATRLNADKNNARVSALVSDLFTSVKGGFDLIVFNPPYLPANDAPEDITYSGGLSGRETIERFAKEARSRLNERGKILVLISSLTGEKEVIDVLKSSGFFAKATVRRKVPWEELIVIEARAGIHGV